MHNDPHEAGERLSGYSKHTSDETFLQALNECLLEACLPSKESCQDISNLPVIYIVGAPRSGTTLLSQLVSRCLPVGYINNMSARFWLRPSVGIRLSQILLGDSARQEIDFNSIHGSTTGLASPHEFGYFWRHWFKLDGASTHHLSVEELTKVDSLGLKNTLENEILAPFQTPVVFKNVICGFQAPLLGAIHNKSLFIHITRNLRSTCASILKSRFERYGSYSTWWSLKPSTFPTFPGCPVPQAVKQVVDCRRELDAQIAASGMAVMNIHYEDLCLDPNNVLNMICSEVGRMGWPMKPIFLAPALKATTCPQLPDALMKELDAEIDENTSFL